MTLPAQTPARQELISLRLESDGSDEGAERACVCEPVWVVVERMQRTLRLQSEARFVVLATVPAKESRGDAAPLVDAGVAALRGLIYSLTLELGERAAVNLVLASPGQEEDVDAALRFLASEDAQWVRGATLDLQETPSCL